MWVDRHFLFLQGFQLMVNAVSFLHLYIQNTHLWQSKFAMIPENFNSTLNVIDILVLL